MLTLLLASANAAPSGEQPAAGASLEFNKDDGTLYFDWSGPIVARMADDLRAALDKYGTVLDRVVLFLDSAGGQVEEGDRVISVLNEIKLRHQLTTVVPHGKLCASMCIPIFLQGEDRLAARASLWIFHEAAQRQANGEPRTDMAETWRLFRKYYAPAGVSMHWLKSIAPMIKEADLWQTGGDLISAKSGIIMHPLGDRTERAVVPSAAVAKPSRRTSSLFPDYGTVLSREVWLIVQPRLRRLARIREAQSQGAKPAELPVLQSTRSEFVINIETARALGVKISDNLLSLANKVIE